MELRCMGCMQVKTSSPVCEHCGYDEQTQNNVHQLPVGTVVGGQYTLGKVLGQGGFGITYIGWDNIMQQRVAVKEYFPTGYAGRDSHSRIVTSYDRAGSHDFENNKRRFLREAEALAKLWDIPQIVRVLRYFEENGTAYIAMEYVEGMDLRKYLKKHRGPLSMEETLSLLGPIMEALSLVHKAELVHRDISPDNIMVLPDGSTKLLDFGAARYVENADAEKERATSTQTIMKHGFAPPEQYSSRGALGPWTDVYAMCATIYYCLAGKVPPEAMLRTVDGVQIDWEAVGNLSRKQKNALEKGLELQAKNRFASAAELWKALQPEPVKQTAPKNPPEQSFGESVREKPKKKKGKRGILALAAAAVLAAVVGISAVSLRPSVDSAEEPRMTDSQPQATVGEVPVGTEAVSSDVPYKIGIITGPGEMWEEEYVAAQNLKTQYGSMVVTATYPENYATDTEGIIAAVRELASDPQMKAIVFVQAVPGAAEAMTQVRAMRDDILLIAGACGEQPEVISGAADICLNLDEVGMGPVIIEQALRQGAKTFVHLSFERHLGYPVIADRQNLFKQRCAELGLEYVEATVPDPTGDAGVTGAQAWITENIKVYVDKYGRDTAFFCTNCSMQPPLIQQCAELGAIYPLQCCPSPYHAYPAAFHIQMDGHQGDVPYLLEQITNKVAEYGNRGRMSTWEVPINMLMVEAGFSYARKWIEGSITERCDGAALLTELQAVAGEGVSVTSGTFPNYYLILCPFYNFGEIVQQSDVGSESDGNVYTVTATEMIVRSAPSTAAAVIGSLNLGEQVVVARIETIAGVRWGYISSPVQGWIPMDFVEKDGAAGMNDAAIKKTVSASGLNIRKEPDTASPVVGSYSKGDVVIILEIRDNWGRTNMGWIRMEYTEDCNISSYEYPPDAETDRDEKNDAQAVSLKLKYEDITLVPDFSYQLMLDCELEQTDVSWYSEHPHIAKVDERGVVTALENGNTRIFAVYGDQKVSCLVRVG